MRCIHKLNLIRFQQTQHDPGDVLKILGIIAVGDGVGQGRVLLLLLLDLGAEQVPVFPSLEQLAVERQQGHRCCGNQH